MRRLRFADKLLRVRDEPDPLPPGFPPSDHEAPLVCIHGAGMSSVVFVDLLRRVSRSLQRRVIAPDLPGHGQSDRWHETISIDGYRDAVGAVCAHLGVKKAVLLGHSMGAAVALRLALSYPERVAGLVLLNGAGALPVAAEVFALLEAVLPDDSAPPGAEQVISEPLPGPLADLMFSPHALPELRARWQAVLLSAKKDVVLEDFRACAAFDCGASDALSGLRVPTLCVCGADDLMVRPRRTRESLEQIPEVRIETVPRTGHLTHLEDPDRFHELLASFLQTI